MSAEHKRPLFAFVVVTILCAVMLGHAIRSDALGGLLGSIADRPVASAPDRVVLPPRVDAPATPAPVGHGPATSTTEDVPAPVSTGATTTRPDRAATRHAAAIGDATGTGQAIDPVVTPQATTVPTTTTVPATTTAPATPTTVSTPTGPVETVSTGPGPEQVSDKAARDAQKAADKAARDAQKAADEAARDAQQAATEAVLEARQTAKDAEKAVKDAEKAAKGHGKGHDDQAPVTTPVVPGAVASEVPVETGPGSSSTKD
ncbi:hypothetical protein [Nocardioides sp. P5_C9_2]